MEERGPAIDGVFVVKLHTSRAQVRDFIKDEMGTSWYEVFHGQPGQATLWPKGPVLDRIKDTTSTLSCTEAM